MTSVAVRRVALAVAAGVGGAAIASLLTTGPALASSPCGWRPANNSNITAASFDDGVNIRNGTDLGCPVLGLGYATQGVSVRCWANGAAGDTWFYLTDTSTGVTGWSRSYLVSLYGARPPHPRAC